MLINDSLDEFSYDANLAGLSYTLSYNHYGLAVSFSGYSDKIGFLMNKVFDKIFSFQVDPFRFETFKKNVSNRILFSL